MQHSYNVIFTGESASCKPSRTTEPTKNHPQHQPQAPPPWLPEPEVHNQPQAADNNADGETPVTFSNKLNNPNSALEKTPISQSPIACVNPNSSAFDNSPAFSTFLSIFLFSAIKFEENDFNELENE